MLTLWTDVTYPRRMEPSHPYPSTKGIYRLRSNSHTPPGDYSQQAFRPDTMRLDQKVGQIYQDIHFLKQLVDFQNQRIDKIMSMVEELYDKRGQSLSDNGINPPPNDPEDGLIHDDQNLSALSGQAPSNSQPMDLQPQHHQQMPQQPWQARRLDPAPPPQRLMTVPQYNGLDPYPALPSLVRGPKSPRQQAGPPPTSRPSAGSVGSLLSGSIGSLLSGSRGSVTTMSSSLGLIPTMSTTSTTSMPTLTNFGGPQSMNHHMVPPVPETLMPMSHTGKKRPLDGELSTRPPSKHPPVTIEFLHNPTTVRQIYDEFTKGFGGQPPLAELDEKYGKLMWRGDLRLKELKRFQRRKKLVDAIERGMQRYGKSADEIIQYIEDFRGDKSLTWVMNGHLPDL